MAGNGPAPTPTAVLAARGSWRAGTREGEPQSPVCVPECPEWVSEKAREWWPEIAGQLAEMAVMTAPYAVTLALLTDALADYLEVKEALKGEPLTYTTDKGSVGKNPLVTIKEDAWKRVILAAKEFGLTPASRTRTRIESAGKEKKGKARLFKTA